MHYDKKNLLVKSTADDDRFSVYDNTKSPDIINLDFQKVSGKDPREKTT